MGIEIPGGKQLMTKIFLFKCLLYITLDGNYVPQHFWLILVKKSMLIHSSAKETELFSSWYVVVGIPCECFQSECSFIAQDIMRESCSSRYLVALVKETSVCLVMYLPCPTQLMR